MLHSCRVLRLESCRRKETGYTSESVILPCIVGSPIHVWKLAYFHTSVLPGQYKYQPYQKPLWNTANPKMTVKNQTKQAPERNWPFDIYFRTPKVNRNFLLNRVQTLYSIQLIDFIFSWYESFHVHPFWVTIFSQVNTHCNCKRFCSTLGWKVEWRG